MSRPVLDAMAALDAAAATTIEQLHEHQEAIRLALGLHTDEVSERVASHLDATRHHANEAIEQATRARQELAWARRRWDLEAADRGPGW